MLKQSCELKPFTQYLQLAEGVENPPAYLTIVDVNNPSGIDELRSQKANDPEIYYDLQGRLLNGKPQRGQWQKDNSSIKYSVTYSKTCGNDSSVRQNLCLLFCQY